MMRDGELEMCSELRLAVGIAEGSPGEELL
jgi:hypothetical protein